MLVHHPPPPARSPRRVLQGRGLQKRNVTVQYFLALDNVEWLPQAREAFGVCGVVENGLLLPLRSVVIVHVSVFVSVRVCRCVACICGVSLCSVLCVFVIIILLSLSKDFGLF